MLTLSCKRGQELHKDSVSTIVSGLFEKVHHGRGNMDPVTITVRPRYNEEDLLAHAAIAFVDTESELILYKVLEKFLRSELVVSIVTEKWALSICKMDDKVCLVELYDVKAGEADHTYMDKNSALREFFNTLYDLLEKDYSDYQRLETAYNILYDVAQSNSCRLEGALELVSDAQSDLGNTGEDNG